MVQQLILLRYKTKRKDMKKIGVSSLFVENPLFNGFFMGRSGQSELKPTWPPISTYLPTIPTSGIPGVRVLWAAPWPDGGWIMTRSGIAGRQGRRVR